MTRLQRRLTSRRDDSGAVAVVVAICTVLLFSMGAVAVDAGQLYNTHRSAQTTADLAALAGAARLPGQPTQACRTAVTFLLKNKPSNEAFNVTPDDCTATGTSDANKTVEILDGNTRLRVNVPQREVGFGFASVIGFDKGYTDATATAAIRSPAGLNPFAVATTMQS